MTRAFFVWLHRWVGLVIAGFLILVGLTGSLLAFNAELERMFAPELFAASQAGAPLSLAELAERAQAIAPGAPIESVTYTEPDQVTVALRKNEKAEGSGAALGFDEIFLDPWTGKELGRRKHADLSQGLINLMPFIYDLHWRLALGSTGSLILGFIAIAWTIDCFVGFYLTLPQTLEAFWRRWKPAWLIKRHGGFYRLNFDLHRAGGLWFWALLFVFAWSGVMMDIRPAYEWVMTRVFDYRGKIETFVPLMEREKKPLRLDWRAAQATGERLMAEQAAKHGFTVYFPLGLNYIPQLNAYLYSAHGSDDVFERSPSRGGSYVIFDAHSGELLALSRPTGERTGNTIEGWLYALHMARVFGMPYRLLVCALGIVVAVLSGTGAYIWWKKRRARRLRNADCAPSRSYPSEQRGFHQRVP